MKFCVFTVMTKDVLIFAMFFSPPVVERDVFLETMLRDSSGVAVATSLALGAVLALYWLRRSRQGVPTKWRKVGKVGKIYCYPVKSCSGLAVERADCLKSGVSCVGGRDRFVALVITDKFHILSVVFKFLDKVFQSSCSKNIKGKWIVLFAGNP
jgi:hypothetical protein